MRAIVWIWDMSITKDYYVVQLNFLIKASLLFAFVLVCTKKSIIVLFGVALMNLNK